MALCVASNGVFRMVSLRWESEKGRNQPWRRFSCNYRLHPKTKIRRPDKASINSQSRANGKEVSGWDAKKSFELYRMHAWGSPYFDINAQGNVCVRPWPTSSEEIDIMDVILSLKSMDVELPVILKFPEIVLHRVQELHQCFKNAIARYGYAHVYQGVFPVKCNHDSVLIDKIMEFGFQYKYGLEVGSKAELLIAISKLLSNKHALLICNGYKDKVYVQTALLARQLDLKVVIVLEQLEELDLVIELGRTLGIEPIIGVRAKLSTEHDSHWAGTSGEKGKFGLSTRKILELMQRLREEKMLKCLKVLHFHIGSQIPCISDIKRAIIEASHIYCELVLMGACLNYIDVGGGLGIDYNGTNLSNSSLNSSVNYSMQQYANEVVVALKHTCIAKDVPEPIIISENGRALVSHHSVIAFNVLNESKHIRPLSSSRNTKKKLHENHSNDEIALDLQSHFSMYLKGSSGHDDSLENTVRTMKPMNIQKAYIEAEKLKHEAHILFNHGRITLEQKAQAEALHDAVLLNAFKELDLLHGLDSSPLVTTYHINLSVFQSIPDSWAIKQIFPILPLHRLHEKPNVKANLFDLTCDSDGKIDSFIGPCGRISNMLSVHPLQEGEAYFMGLFLAGAYQEILGSTHNLFGEVNVVNVRSNTLGKVNQSINRNFKGNYSLQVQHGQTCKEVLEAIQHDTCDMIEKIESQLEGALQEGQTCMERAEAFLKNYKATLDSYTYLTK